MYSFNDREKEILRFLKAEFLAKGEKPATMLDPGILNREVKAHFKTAHSEYKEMMTRFAALGIVAFNPHVMEETVTPNNGLLYVKPLVVEIVRQLDEDALLKKKLEPPNHLDRAKRWALSKWWIVGPVAALLVIVWLINQFKPILEWFGLKK